MDLDQRFSDLVDELCSRPGVLPPGGNGFGSHALKVNGSTNKGRAMTEWLTVLDESAWDALAVEALVFVQNQCRHDGTDSVLTRRYSIE
jgi:hypothetical protein